MRFEQVQRFIFKAKKNMFKFGQRVHYKKFPVITLITGRVSLIQGFLSLKKIESVNWKKKICFPCEYNDKHVEY